MGRTKQYDVAGQHFSRQVDLEAAVKAHLNSHPLNTRFRDNFLAAVINELHPDVRAAGQHSTGEFEYLDWGEQLHRGMDSAFRYRGGKVVVTLFEPLGDWRDVTVYPWRGQGNHRRDVKTALREKIAPYLPKPQKWDRCAALGCQATGADLEYQHTEPVFDTLAEECLALMSDDEITARFGYSKFVLGRDELAHCIPANHPAFRHLLAAHQANRWQWLCAFHHRGVAAAEGPAQLSLV